MANLTTALATQLPVAASVAEAGECAILAYDSFEGEALDTMRTLLGSPASYSGSTVVRSRASASIQRKEAKP